MVKKWIVFAAMNLSFAAGAEYLLRYRVESEGHLMLYVLFSPILQGIWGALLRRLFYKRPLNKSSRGLWLAIILGLVGALGHFSHDFSWLIWPWGEPGNTLIYNAWIVYWFISWRFFWLVALLFLRP
ncbi:MAG: hypothetical protein AAB443_01520 [Patescibacteria group bacterium]